MKRKWYTGLSFYVVAPIVMIGAVAALVLTLLATYENYSLGRATDQIIRVVSLARDLRLANETAPERAATVFFTRMEQVAPSEVIQISSPFLGEKSEQGVKNPWGGVMRVFFYPSAASVRLETALSSGACRRLLFFYAKDALSLGIRRVDVRSADAGSVWRMLYQEKGTGSVLSPEAIYSGCGSDQTILSLTFSLS